MPKTNPARVASLVRSSSVTGSHAMKKGKRGAFSRGLSLVGCPQDFRNSVLNLGALELTRLADSP